MPDPTSPALTESQLAELQKSYDAATPGQWKLWAAQAMADQHGDSDHDKAVLVANTYYRNECGQLRTNDASLICEMQRALPALLSAARRSLEYEAFFREHRLALVSGLAIRRMQALSKHHEDDLRKPEAALSALLSRLK